jgi:hypothetical protein
MVDSGRQLRSSSCPWDEAPCMAAASVGHLEILKYVHEQGYPWDAHTCMVAEPTRHTEILEWARQHTSWTRMKSYGSEVSYEEDSNGEYEE